MKIALAAFLLSTAAAAQNVSEKARTDLLAGIVRELRGKYVDPDKARTGAAELEKRWKAVDWAPLGDAHAFLDRVNADLGDVFHDKHMSVRLAAEAPPVPGDPNSSPREAAEARAQLKRIHHGFVSAMVLPGNVGYLNVIAVPDFDDPGTATAIAQSFDFVADTDALLIDLRGNGGGDPETVAEVMSYLVDGRVHLLDLYDRITGERKSTYTHDKVAGPRYGGKRPVYALTSAGTFSGGEELAYDLQTLGRAKLLGEATGGGANNNVFLKLGEFVVSISYGRVESPRTHSNWEGKGVQPDVATPRAAAFTTALRAATQAIAAAETDERRRDRLHDMAEHADRVPDPGPPPRLGPGPGGPGPGGPGPRGPGSPGPGPR